MDNVPPILPPPSTNLIQQTVDKVLGWWDPGTHKQVPGLDTRVTNLEDDRDRFSRFLNKAVWVGAAVGGVLVLRALGVPTDELWKILPIAGGHP